MSRVGLVSPLPPQLGGVVTVARWLCDHEERIGCRYVPFDLARPVEEAGGRLRMATLRSQVRLLGSFLRWVRRAPGTVHCMISPTATGLPRDVVYVAVLAAMRRRVVAHVHVVRPDLWWWRIGMRLVGSMSAKVVVLGTAGCGALESLGVKSVVIPNAVPFSLSAAAERDTHPKPREGRISMLFVGTFGERKGCHELLRALALLRGEGVKCRLDIVGREEYVGEEARLRTEVAELGLEDDVRFLGQLEPEELPQLYKRSDMFCLPSRLEGLPLALIEAMAHGLPAVATPVGCVEDIVAHERTGLLARVGDPAALAEQIGRLAGDANLRHTLGIAGERRVAEHMGTEVVAGAWRELYETLEGT